MHNPIRSPQRGMTFISFLFILAFLLILVYIGFKLVPHYINYYSVRTSMASLAEESRSEPMTATMARLRLVQKLDINYIDNIKAEHINITRAPSGGLLLTVNYQVRESMVGNLDACIRFRHSVTLANR